MEGLVKGRGNDGWNEVGKVDERKKKIKKGRVEGKEGWRERRKEGGRKK